MSTRYEDGIRRFASLRRWYEAKAGGRTSPPVTWELVTVHALYLLSAALTARAGLAFTETGRPLGANTIEVIIVIAAVCTLLLLWAFLRRSPPFESWFVSHLVWLSLTWAFLAFAFVAGLLVLAIIMILALALPFLGFLVYALMALTWLIAGWFVWRIGTGYLALLRRGPIGSFARV